MKCTRKQQKVLTMDNTKKSIDRWSSLEKTMLNITQPRNSQTPLMESTSKSSTNDKSQNNE